MSDTRKLTAVHQTKRKPSGRSTYDKVNTRVTAKANAIGSRKNELTKSAKARTLPSAPPQVKLDGNLFKVVLDGLDQGVYVQLASGPKLLCPPLKPLGYCVDADGSN